MARKINCPLFLLTLDIASWLSAWQAPATDMFTVDKLTGRVYLPATRSEGGEALGNVVFDVSGEGVLVFDDQFDKQRRGRNGRHRAGNLTFGKMAPIVAHANERKT